MMLKFFAPRSTIRNNGCTVINNNLSDEDFKNIELLMYPSENGGSSTSGFLSIGDEITDVIDSDQKTLEKLCVTYEQIISRLETVINTYEEVHKLVHKYSDEKDRGVYNYNAHEVFKFKIDDECMLIESNLIIKIVPPNEEIFMCPFMCNKLKHNNHYWNHRHRYGEIGQGSDRRPNDKIFKDVIITNTDTHEVVRFNQILLHMIKSHHFFGGAGNRLDPRVIMRIIGLKPKYIDDLSKFAQANS